MLERRMEEVGEGRRTFSNGSRLGRPREDDVSAYVAVLENTCRVATEGAGAWHRSESAAYSRDCHSGGY